MDRLDRIEERLHSISSFVTAHSEKLTHITAFLEQAKREKLESDNRVRELEGYVKELKGAWKVLVPVASAVGSIAGLLANILTTMMK